MATTYGALEIEKYGISGPAVINACRIISRLNLKNVSFEISKNAPAPDNSSKPRKLNRAQAQPASKVWKIEPGKPRPLKEAMTTIGGVALNEVYPQTMESRKVPGLYFAGEVLDVDGPCGGYNLQAAFSTARLAIESIAKNHPIRKYPPQAQKRRNPREKRYYSNRRRS
ncbi:hypothetical protein GT409_11565 [Tichowtungia aerotolerans]|uniref:RsdA/BaiN/AoA(So)-like Rossmann fold-like domain-containing protein n=1 Tax=Tichowtungia aerotolerans TaxID=2697043 RepID=A0A6P1MFZ7_9BACT|nr:hypothetical protein GT409_11565 [Tichowtungia aerotolerans]